MSSRLSAAAEPGWGTAPSACACTLMTVEIAPCAQMAWTSSSVQIFARDGGYVNPEMPGCSLWLGWAASGMARGKVPFPVRGGLLLEAVLTPRSLSFPAVHLQDTPMGWSCTISAPKRSTRLTPEPSKPKTEQRTARLAQRLGEPRPGESGAAATTRSLRIWTLLATLCRGTSLNQ